MAKMNSGSKTRSLTPTICSAIGMLIGGLGGAWLGVLIGSDSAVVAGYIGGAIAGWAIGAALGYRWDSRRQDKVQPPAE